MSKSFNFVLMANEYLDLSCRNLNTVLLLSIISICTYDR